MTTTAINIIDGALRLISSVTPGEAIEGTEAGNALVVLNQLLAMFSAERALVNVTTIEGFNLTVGQTSYQIGTGAPGFNTIRPDNIVNQWIYDTAAQIRYPLTLWTDEEYNDVPLNTIQSIPKHIYYDKQYPYGVIYIYPVAALSTYQLWIESLKPMLQFSSLTAVMNLPGEYFKGLKYLLADDLAPEYGFDITAGSRLEKKIEEAKTLLKAQNFKRVVATFDPAISGAVGGTILDGFIS